MRLARYHRGVGVQIEEAPRPTLPPGGLVVRTEASGLCSGELMAWYMDQKAPHVLGHEVAGIIEESDDPRFPVGERVFVHHHAPCGTCELCRRGATVHCPTWKRTRLDPGGMAETFAVSAENLNDSFPVSDLDARDAALIEPLACVVKAIRRAGERPGKTAVIGAGALGLMHALVLGPCTLLDIHPVRVAHARALGLNALAPDKITDAFERVFVLPGTPAAIDAAVQVSSPDAVICLFAPLPPDVPMPLSMASTAYFRDLMIVHSYSCGPEDTRIAAEHIRAGRVRAEQVVSDFITLDELPVAYRAMAEGRILKAMVVFP